MDTQAAVNELNKSCLFFGLKAGQYNLHLKVSTDVKNQLNSNTTGPLVSDKLIPFTLVGDCIKN
jgi:hypothetical protein